MILKNIQLLKVMVGKKPSILRLMMFQKNISINVGKKLSFGNFRFDNFAVYQKTDFASILQTPELYTWHSLYYNNTIVKIINLNVGFDVRFNTPYNNPSYSINTSQFYKTNDGIEFSTYPIVDLWLTATLKRTNFFLRYDYINQGLLSKISKLIKWI